MNDFLKILDLLESEGNLRKLPEDFSEHGNFFNLSSNDYLSLAEKWKLFLPEFSKRFSDYGFSSSASRLLSAKQDIFFRFERFISELYHKPALLFNSGYHANVGVVSALANLGSVLFIWDKLVHASVIDGLKLSGCAFKRFPHNDFEKLTEIVRQEHAKYERLIIVVESVYSMEGDCAPLQKIVSLKKEFPKLIVYVDEAHAFGVRGKKGLGMCEELDLIPNVDLLMATLGKAAASTGAFVVCNNEIKEFFINKSRSLIFSTALPPVNVAWSYFMTEKLIGMNSERNYLGYISKDFKLFLEATTGKPNPSQSQIIPLVTEDSKKALEIAKVLKRDFKIIALPIRRPTVPPGKECLRISLHSDLSREQINYVKDAITQTI